MGTGLEWCLKGKKGERRHQKMLKQEKKYNIFSDCFWESSSHQIKTLLNPIKMLQKLKKKIKTIIN